MSDPNKAAEAAATTTTGPKTSTPSVPSAPEASGQAPFDAGEGVPVKSAPAPAPAAPTKAVAAALAPAKAAAPPAPSPRILSIIPAKAAVGSIVTISGENFGEADEDAYDASYTDASGEAAAIAANAAPIRRRANTKVLVHGKHAPHVSFWSPTLIKFHVPHVMQGEGMLTLQTPDGSSAKQFEITS